MTTQTITALTLQKRDKSRINIFLDGEYAFSLSLDVALGLRRGQHLDPAAIEPLHRQDESLRAYYHALRLLGYQSRGQAEVERHLHQEGYAAPAMGTAIERLLVQHDLDNAAFAQAWVEHRERCRPRGARALRDELRHKGVDTQIMDSTVNDMDEDASAWSAIERKLAG